MSVLSANNNNKSRAGVTNHSKVHQKFDDPELEAEVAYAKSNGLALPKVLPSDAPVKKMVETLAEVVAVVDGGVSNKAERKARHRGVSGCSTKKDGDRFEYGLDCIDLAYEERHSSRSDDEDSCGDMEAEYDQYADYSITYSAAEVEEIVGEYFDHGNIEEALDSLEKFSLTKDTSYKMLKSVLQLAVSGLPSALSMGTSLLEHIVWKEWVSTSVLLEGIDEVLGHLDKLSLDIPTIASNLSVLIAKLAEDKYVRRSQVEGLSEKYANSEKARECCTDALSYIANRTLLHGKMEPCGAHVSLDVLSEQFRKILREYLQSNDTEDASHRVRLLKVPHFNHDFVYQACVLALEKMNDAVMFQLAKLLKAMYDNGTLLESCIGMGFNRLFENLTDLSIDLPAAHALAKRWVDKACKEGIVPKDTAQRCPHERTRRRTLSSGPDGKLSCMDDESEAVAVQ